MKLITFPDTMAQEWDAFVAQWPHLELMQSYHWGIFKKSMGWKVIRLGVEKKGQLVAGVQMLIKILPLGLRSIAYIPRGPLLNWEDESVVETLLSTIHTIARQHNAIYLKIEPAIHFSPIINKKLLLNKFCHSPFNNQPQSTILIDVSFDHDTILAKMKQSTRYNIRYSLRKGVVIREGAEADLGIFYDLMVHTAKRAGFPNRSREYFEQEWKTLAPTGHLKLFLATYKGEVLAARMPVKFGKVAATFHSGHFCKHTNLKFNELLMWECIKWAKSVGCSTYDVWGIPDEIGKYFMEGKALPKQQKGGLWGGYHFKRGFGGDVIHYIGAYDYIYSKPLYQLQNMAMNCLGSLEKLANLGDRLKLTRQI